jgi:ABC-type glutathione transport system ATPase component
LISYTVLLVRPSSADERANRVGLLLVCSLRMMAGSLKLGAVQASGLRALLDRSPRNLSGGERQRAGIGRALLTQPKVLLMEKVMSSLLARSRNCRPIRHRHLRRRAKRP